MNEIPLEPYFQCNGWKNQYKTKSIFCTYVPVVMSDLYSWTLRRLYLYQYATTLIQKGNATNFSSKTHDSDKFHFKHLR